MSWAQVAAAAAATFVTVLAVVVMASGIGRSARGGGHGATLHSLRGGVISSGAGAGWGSRAATGIFGGSDGDAASTSRSKSGLRCAIIALIRGSDTMDGYESLRARNKALHEHFNARYGYDNILFHEGDIKPEHMREIMAETPHTKFINIMPYGAFKVPSWVRLPLRKQPDDKPIGYKHMCRFFMLQVWDAVRDYDYVMRFDDDVVLETEMVEDPFEFMYERDIVYTYSVEVPEWHGLTNRTFFDWARAYVKEKGIATQHEHLSNTMFFTHFFIADVTFWRQLPVQSMLHAIDDTGNVYKYRWGDAPIQTVLLKTFLQPDSLYKMHGLEYCHYSTGHCLRDGAIKGLDPEAKADLDGVVAHYVAEILVKMAVGMLPNGWGAPEVLEGKSVQDLRDLLIHHLGDCAGEASDHLAWFSYLELLTWAAQCFKWDLERDLPQLEAIKNAKTHEEVRAIVDKDVVAHYHLNHSQVNDWTDTQLHLYMSVSLPMTEDDRNSLVDMVSANTGIPIRIVQFLSNSDLHEICRVKYMRTEGTNAALRELVEKHVRTTPAYGEPSVVQTVLAAHVPMLYGAFTDAQLHSALEMLLAGSPEKEVFKALHNKTMLDAGDVATGETA